jgi:hypothetical protein
MERQFAAYSVLKDPVGTICTTRFDIQKMRVVPPERIHIFCGSQDRQGLFYNTYSINGLVFVTAMECLLRGTTRVF